MVTILMATYNGERYISEQIESILRQTYTNWELIIQDDCSTDDTAAIVYRYIKRYPKKIRFIERENSSGSASRNFSSMFKFVKRNYVMTCDQDDVWLPNKIEITLKEMHRLEAELGYDKPLLVHSDLKVVDCYLNVIFESMFKSQKLDHLRDKPNNLLVQNIVTGCTMLFNKALLDIVQVIPKEAVMHDWWLALITSIFGKIGFVDQPTILYRQHERNEVGAKNAKSLRYNLRRLLELKDSKNALQITYLQAETLLMLYKGILNPQTLELVRMYSEIPRYNKIKKLRTIWQYGFWKISFLRRLGQIVFC